MNTATEQVKKIKISDDFIQAIILHIETIRQHQWALGDYLVLIMDTHEMDTQEQFKRSDILKQIAGETGATYTMLDDHERTSRRWPEEDRLAIVDWTIYRNAKKEDFPLIEKAADEGWNSTRFKEEMYPGSIAPIKLASRILATMQRLSKMKEIAPSVLERLYRLIGEVELLQDELDK